MKVLVILLLNTVLACGASAMATGSGYSIAVSVLLGVVVRIILDAVGIYNMIASGDLTAISKEEFDELMNEEDNKDEK